jgi:hypothetical protein
LITGADISPDSGLAELYDPAADMFSPTGAFGLYISGEDGLTIDAIYTASLLTNGKVLFVGTDANWAFPADAVYDPALGTFSSLIHAPGPHASSAATQLPDGTVLITGDQLAGGNGDVVAELYTPATGTFAFTGNMSAGRHQHTATLLTDGTVLVAGGYRFWPVETASAEIYHPSVLIPAPILYSVSGDSQGQGAILHASSHQLASPDNPAVAGEALEIYLIGLADGSVIAPQVAIGGQMAEVLFFGKAPGFSSLNQVNVRVPSGVVPGLAVPVRLAYLGRPSNEVTIGVR